MSRALSIVLVLVLAFYVAAPVFAKKHPTTTTTAPTTQEAAKGKETAVETHKHRAAEFENGVEVLRQLRANGVKVPFGFVTSESTPEMKQAAEDAGALFLVTKPFTADTFRDALDPILG